MINKLYKISQGLNKRFPEGNEPFRIVTRLAEELGELAEQVHHFEGSGIKREKHGDPDKQKLAKEIQDILTATLHLTMYYGVENELAERIDLSYKRVIDEGLVEP